MAVELVVGHSSEGTSNAVSNYLYWERIQAVGTANGATQFRVFCNASCNVKVGVRADATGEPGILMGHNDTAQGVVSGWNTLSISGNNISNGTYYWLGIIADDLAVMRETSGGTSRYQYFADFSTYTFPETLEESYSTGNHVMSIAVWGETGGTSIIPQAHYYMN